tara:strand:- start:422 stop:1177 length:756 start_codon:yes stop_codon:yes gene_type:complete
MAAKKKTAKETKTESNKGNPTARERNNLGLIDDGSVEYIYDENGLVDWRKMVKEEFLVANKQKTKETDISKLDDKDLLILLGGIKNLAQIRGFRSVEYKVYSAAPDYVMASCGIRWVPNFETEGEEVYFEAMADASLSNTKSFARNFLAAIAENRAFVRCVRNFLRINVVGSDEMGDANLFTESNANATAAAGADPHSLLSSVMKEKSVSFENLNKKLIGEGKVEEGAWSSVQDIPKSQIFALIKRLKTIG